jgi:hypothetical protein
MPWYYDFFYHCTDDDRVFRTLNVLDESSRECREIRVKRKLNLINAIEVLAALFILGGIPTYTFDRIMGWNSLRKPCNARPTQFEQDRIHRAGEAVRGRIL